MGYTDFEYNGLRLSDFGCMVCSFDNPGLETSSVGSKITLNTIQSKTNKFHLSSIKYEEVYSEPFQICKYRCHEPNEDSFSKEELSKIISWLNKKTYNKFKPIYPDGEYSPIYYMGTFNIQKITLAGEVIGLELTFIADAPWGYYEPLEYIMDFSDPSTEFIIHDISDEVGYIYPSLLEIECLSGTESNPVTLRISNSQENKVVEIKGCKKGEVIALEGEYKKISTNVSHPILYNDFNYNFVKVIRKENWENGYEDENSNINIYTVNEPCIIHLIYSPICKLGVL